MRYEQYSPLIIGMTGSGKTVFAQHWLLALAPRAVILDRKSEYEDGGIFESALEAIEFYRAHPREDWHIIVRDPNPDAHIAVMDVIATAQELQGLPPVAFFVEESSYYSTTHNIGPVIDALYTKGRHGKINVVSVVQRLTQVHPIVRDMSHVWLSFRVRSPSTPQAQQFTLEDLEQISTLETLRPGVRPVYGKHFLTDTGEPDILRRWALANA